MFEPTDPRRNRLLAALPEAEWQRLSPQLEHVEMPFGRVCYVSGFTPSHVYFPLTALVSLLYLTKDGASSEFAVVGNEGLVGISLLMGGDSTTGQAVVQSAGHACRMDALAVKAEFERGGPFMQLSLRYTQALVTQMAQTAVCNRHHALDQQLCRLLLLRLDRLGGSELAMTHELIANMLGVRREGITEAASKLEKLGLIHYSRGRIGVLNHDGLRQRACECYAVVNREYERLLPAR
jgi:CRP-like cAMP-binding protein